MTARIALDLRMLVDPPDGISRYALELAGRLPLLMKDAELVTVGRADKIRRRLPQARVLEARTTSISLREQAELPALLYGHRVDLFHATLFVAPLVWHRPYVLTLHDVNYLALPQLYGRHRELYFQTAVRLFAKRAAAIVTVSEFSRVEIERRLGVPAERVEVIPNGIDPRFRPLDEAARGELLGRLGLPRDYLLYVGSFAPHKNVPLLLRAYARLADAPTLVLCGQGPDRIRPEIERLGLQNRVRLLQGQGDEALVALYSGATAFVFPSLYEGFGLPPLEAMACGAPTIVSDAGSLPEVTGGAALTFPVHDDAALAEQIQALLDSPQKRTELAAAGRRRAEKFRWEACVEQVAGVYRRLL